MNAKLRSFSMKTMTALVVLQATSANASNLTLDTMPEDPLHRLSTYLPLNDLQSLEQVCKHTATSLRDAPLYQALTLAHPPKKATRFPVPGKDRILKLINGVNPDFILTLAGYMLDENFFGQKNYQLFDFPLNGNAYRPKTLPLKTLRASLLTLILGFKRPTAATTAKARYYLAHMDDLGLGGHQDLNAARQGLSATLNDPAAPADLKAKACFKMAQMDYQGQGGNQDLGAAKEGFTAVLADPATHANFKAQARSYLDQMNRENKRERDDFETKEDKRARDTSDEENSEEPSGKKRRTR